MSVWAALLDPSPAQLALRVAWLLVLSMILAGRTRERRRLALPTSPSLSAAPARRLDTRLLLADVRTLSSADYAGRRAGSVGGRLARRHLVQRFAEHGLQPLTPGYLQPFAFDHTSWRALWTPGQRVRTRIDDAANVVACLPGGEPQRGALLIAAHYDHLGVRAGRLYPGADDNAAGVALLLALAGWCRSRSFRHRLVFAAFDAEEWGCRGARAFAATLDVPLNEIALVVNLDTLARSSTGRLYVAGTWHTPALARLVARVRPWPSVSLHLGHDRPIWRTGLVADWTRSSDHAVFHAGGRPFLYLGGEPHADYHTPRDTFERIEPAFFCDVAETVLDLLLTLDAGADLIPARAGRGRAQGGSKHAP
jgi:hypothetical protein